MEQPLVHGVNGGEEKLLAALYHLAEHELEVRRLHEDLARLCEGGNSIGNCYCNIPVQHHTVDNTTCILQQIDRGWDFQVSEVRMKYTYRLNASPGFLSPPLSYQHPNTNIKVLCINFRPEDSLFCTAQLFGQNIVKNIVKNLLLSTCYTRIRTAAK